jgi:hypothetical protein
VKKEGGFVIIKIPTWGAVGLGNMMFVWARGVAFAKKNKLQYHTTTWFKFFYILRSYLIGRKDVRNYYPYFNRQLNFTKYATSKLPWVTKIVEPDFEISVENKDEAAYIFNKIPNWSNYFKDIKAYRNDIINEFYAMLSKTIINDVNAQQIPIIAVHVRLGDFQPLNNNTLFKNVGNTRTPLSYFILLIEKIRKINGENLRVAIFSNGNIDELNPLLSLPNTYLSNNSKYDITELILMAKSKLLITSAGSTFSYWSAFLGDIPVINHFEHIHSPIRDESTNQLYFEGGVDPYTPITEWPSLLIKNIKDIACD